ncbi:unnamed protein product [Ectocarpus sp. 12 AP-2014]
MNKTTWVIAIDIACEFVPFTDILSDVILLIAVWPRTAVVAPDDVEGCGERALWYLALSFTVVGTLVDLFPEMLLVSEIVLHPSVLTSPGSMGTLLRLVFSDGKPVVVFAATEEFEKPLAPPLLAIRDSLRRRLSSVATAFFLRDGCGASSPKWTYAGLVGVLVGGELLTAIGACLFLRIEFGWPALISLLASLLALLISVRCHMRRVGEKTLHLCHESATGNGGRLFEFLLPGPVTLTRFLLAVPVWPMLLVYSEGASFWPFSMASRGDHSLPPSEESLWANPWDWFRVAVPSLSRSDNDSPLSYVYWAIVPHLLWTLVSAVWVGLLGAANLVCWYFGHAEDWSAHSWGVYFSSQESPFSVWSSRLQSALGMGFTAWAAREFRRLLAFSAALAAVVVQGYRRGACLEQEWAFVFAVAAWWIAVLIGHAARKKNIFKPLNEAAGPAVANRW